MTRTRWPAGTLAIAKADSLNAKIGVASTTYAAQSSCPASCRFRDGGGCYAEDGRISKAVTHPLNTSAAARAHEPRDVAIAEAQAIDGLPRGGQPLRLHTVGDCPDEISATIVSAAAERFSDEGGGPVWTYTHGWREVPREAWGAVSVLASCETAADVAAARARGYAAALTVEAFPGPRRYRFAEGVDVLPCPAQTKDAVTCTSCRLCFDDAKLRARGLTIGFALHGTMLTLRRARQALRDPDDPDRRLSSRHLIPRYLAEHPGATSAEIAEALGFNHSTIAEMRRKLDAEAAELPEDEELASLWRRAAALERERRQLRRVLELSVAA